MVAVLVDAGVHGTLASDLDVCVAVGHMCVCAVGNLGQELKGLSRCSAGGFTSAGSVVCMMPCVRSCGKVCGLGVGEVCAVLLGAAAGRWGACRA